MTETPSPTRPRHATRDLRGLAGAFGIRNPLPRDARASRKGHAPSGDIQHDRAAADTSNIARPPST